jgi:hypothetical protein
MSAFALLNSTTPLNAGPVVSRTHGPIRPSATASLTGHAVAVAVVEGAVGGALTGAVAGAVIFNGPGAAVGALAAWLGGGLAGGVVSVIHQIIGDDPPPKTQDRARYVPIPASALN